MGKKLLFRMLAVGLGLSLGAGAIVPLELSHRAQESAAGLVLPFDQPGRKYALDPEVAAGGDALNSAGFNDREWSIPRTPGVARVAIMGDSVSFGAGLAQTEVYPRVAQALLEADGRAVELFNFSVYGYDIEQIAATVKHVAWGYEPDLVVYAYFTNDHIPSDLVHVGEDRSPVFVGSRVPEGLDLPFSGLALPLTARSAIYRRWLGAKVARHHDAFRTERTSQSATAAFMTEHFNALVADVKAHDVPLIVFGLAPHLLADPNPETCGGGHKRPGFCGAQLAQLRRMHARAYALDVPFISAVPYLQAGGETSYFRSAAAHDIHHPNAAGHAQFAAGLAELVSRWMDGEGQLAAPEPLPAGFERQPIGPADGAESSSRASRQQLREVGALDTDRARKRREARRRGKGAKAGRAKGGEAGPSGKSKAGRRQPGAARPTRPDLETPSEASENPSETPTAQ